MSLDTITHSPAWLALGSAVVHFLWQGVLIGALAAFVLGAMGRRSAAARYTAASGALVLCLAVFVATLLDGLADLRSAAPGAPLGRFLAMGGGAEAASGSGLAGITGPAAWIWAVGVLVMAARFALQSRAALRLKSTAVSDPDPQWQRCFERLKEQLGVTRAVRLLQSGLAEVPMVVGWLSPVVLVPASAFTVLNPDELRSLLAHELAHVRRHDHLFNAVQAVVEAVLFFHPAIWWISKQLREEREYCCDESSVRVVGDPRLLAEALTAMERLRTIDPTTSTVLAALSAHGGPLMKRITRILGARSDARTPLSSWKLPTGLALAGVLAVAGSAVASPGVNQERGSEERSAQEHAAQERSAQKRAAQERKQATEHERRAEMERVKAELRAGVRAGKLTQKEADERFEGYLRHVEEREHARAQYAKVGAELDRLVEAGEITRAQADERLVAYGAKLGRSREAEAARKELARIKRAVEAGTLTREEAAKLVERHKRSLEAAGVEKRREDPEAVLRKIEAAVQAGQLTPEQGRQKIADYKRKLADKNSARERKDPETMVKAIQAAVESGKLTPAEGREKIASIERDLAMHEHFEQLQHEVEAGVKAGVLTKEEAQLKLHTARMKMAAGEVARGTKTVEEVEAGIHAAVRAGKLTPDQGRQMMTSFERSLAQTKKQETPEKERVKRR